MNEIHLGVRPRRRLGPVRDADLQAGAIASIGLGILLLSMAWGNPSSGLTASSTMGRTAGESIPLVANRAVAEPSLTGPVAIGNQSVHFAVGGLGLSAVYEPTVTTTNGSLEVGGHANATVGLAGTMANVSLSLTGFAPVSVTVPALGSQSVLVPGINDTVAGFPVSVYIELNGVVNGTTFVGSNGTGGGSAFSWSKPGNLSIPFVATGPADSRVEVGASNLSYLLTVGIVGKGEADGIPFSVDLVAPATLPGAAGSPANVVGIYEIVPPIPTVPPFPTLPSPATPAPASKAVLSSTDWAIVGIAAALVIGAMLGWVLSGRSGRGSRVPRDCPGCGTRLARGATFCSRCGRPVAPSPASEGVPTPGAGPPAPP